MSQISSLSNSISEQLQIKNNSAFSQRINNNPKIIDTGNSEEDNEGEYNEENSSKKIILNKFLNDSNLATVDYNNKGVKKPIPIPRKKLKEQRRDSNSSTGTFNVPSPKILPKIGSSKLGDTQESKTVKSPTQHGLAIGLSQMYDTGNESGSSEETNNVTLQNRYNKKYTKYHRVEKNTNINKTFINQDTFIELENNTSENITSDSPKYRINNSKNTSAAKNNKIKIKKSRQEISVSSRPGSSTEIEPKDGIVAISDDDKNLFDYQTITEIIIHKSDRLLLNSFVIHPVVKIHVVDIRNGQYFKKSDKNRAVTFYYENDNNNYILPVMSNYFNLQENRSLYPKWEETIIFNEDFNYFVNENLIVFFEIMDFSTSNLQTLKKNKEYQKGWYKIAFAFLKVVGKDNFTNVNRKVQLQLYYIQNTKMPELDNCELWELWQKKKLKKYPSSLFVTIKPLISPKRILQSFRSKTPLQEEVIFNVETRNSDTAEEHLQKEALDIKMKLKNMYRKEKLLPEDFLCEIDSFDDGCFVLKFSNNGDYLACSIKIEHDYNIIIYLVENFEEKWRYQCQEGLIYNIVWSEDDQYLLSASSDKTVAIWNVQSNIFSQILPHHSFVYTCDINCEKAIATGCYDQIVRIWTFNKSYFKYELAQELKKHAGFVTSVCFTKTNPNYLYSADSQGEIYEWYNNSENWIINRLVDIVDLRGIKINQILLFPNEKRMLIHSRDSALRIISIPSTCVIYWLRGSLNLRVQTFCGISHNGSLVACGSENGLVVIWDVNTGKHLKTLEGFSKKSKVVHCVQFNPKINMLALSHYGSKESILIYGSNENDDECSLQTDTAVERKTRIVQDKISDHEIYNYSKILEKMEKLLI